jgi:hypothetical protein
MSIRWVFQLWVEIEAGLLVQVLRKCCVVEFHCVLYSVHVFEWVSDERGGLPKKTMYLFFVGIFCFFCWVFCLFILHHCHMPTMIFCTFVYLALPRARA